MKIFVLGKIRGSNRSQHILSYLSHRMNTEIVEPRHITLFRSQRLNRLLYFIFGYYFVDLIRALKCDKIFYLAMNDNNLLFIAILRIFRKEIILDFYTSRLFFLGNAKKLNEQSQNCSMQRKIYLFWVDKLRLIIPTKVILLTKQQIIEHATEFRIKNLSEKAFLIPLVVPSYDKIQSNPSENFNVCWWGKASDFHGLEYILEEIAHAKTLIPNLKLYLFDDDDRRAQFLEELVACSSLKISDVEIRTDLTFKSGLSDWLQSNCHVALGTFGSIDGSVSGVANKTIEAWSLRLPVITKATPDVTNQPGFLDATSPAGLSSLIAEIYSNGTLDGQEISNIVQQAHKQFRQNHSKSAFEKKIEYVLNA